MRRTKYKKYGIRGKRYHAATLFCAAWVRNQIDHQSFSFRHKAYKIVFEPTIAVGWLKYK